MKVWKQALPTVLALTLVLGSAAPAMACTGIYVASDLTENGSSYMGRCEDFGTDYVKMFGVSEAADYPEDYIYEDTYGFSWPYGGHVYAYTYCKDSPGQGETMTDADGNYIFEAYAEAGQNELGVTMTATVSTAYNEAAEAADPLVETGICEISMGTILLGKSATAREGVELLAKIIDEKGAGECNSIMLADAEETWYFEIVSGHQYAAVKLPAGKVSIQPNITLLGVIDVEDTENVVASADLVKLAEDNGFLVTDEDGKINVAKTYADDNSGIGQYVRYYQGLFYVNPEAAKALGWKGVEDFNAISNADVDNGVELLVDATRTFSTLDVFKLVATRGEETEYFNANRDTYINSKGAEVSYYAIGNSRQAECHIFETRSNLPDQLAILQWQTMGPAEFTVFLPYYTALLTDVADSYKVDDVEYVDGSMYWTCCKLYELCNANRESCENVKTYFEQYQQSIIDQQAQVDQAMAVLYAIDPTLAAEAATKAGKDLADQFYAVSASVLAELEAYIEAGDLSQPFLPTKAAEKEMPVYTVEAPAITRGTLVTILHNLEGKPTAEPAAFTDVTADQTCAPAVAWAAANGIVNGYNDGTVFGAEDAVTLEQMATILYRYAAFKGQDVSASADLSGYTDAAQISGYAKTAVAWAVAQGLLTAADNTLTPGADAACGQVSAVLVQLW